MKRSLAVLSITYLYSALLAAAAGPEIVTGRVIDADGLPMAAAHVAIFDGESNRPVLCPDAGLPDGCFARLLAAGIARTVATTDANGRFTLRVPGGLNGRDMVWAEGREADGRTSLVVSLPRKPG